MIDPETVDSIPAETLVRRAIYSVRVTRTKPLWVGVMDMFSLGSTYANQLCRKHGFNPDAIKRADFRSPHE